MRVARVDERHHVVLGVDVEPDARLAEPVGDAHPEHVDVEGLVRRQVAGEAVDVTEPARPAEVDGRRGAGVLRPAVALVRRRTVRQELHRASVGVGDQDGSLALLVRHAQRRRGGRAPRPSEQSACELEADVVEPRLAAGDQLERVRLVVAGEEGAAVVARALDEPELDAPAGRCLVEVGDPQADVVDAAEADQARPSATAARPRPRGSRARRGASGPRPGAARPARRGRRPTRRSSFVSRPSPVISTSTTSPGAHRPRVRRRPGEDDVARLERDQPAQVGELVRDREEQVVGGRLLDDLAVQVRAQRVRRSGRTRPPGRAPGRAGGSRPGP